MSNPYSSIPTPQSLILAPGSRSCYASLYQPPAPDRREPVASLVEIAEQFSPRYERLGHDLISIDVSGLEKLLGSPRVIARELQREAAAHGVRGQIGVATTQTAARVLALARFGVTVVEPGQEAAALAPLRIEVLEKIHDDRTQSSRRMPDQHVSAISRFKRWGVKTLGELAALPSADLAARLGQQGLLWQAMARGEDVRPLVPDVPEERFESSLELDWPIEGLEPLSFVLTRLLEPLSTRLERRDRGAARLYVALRLITGELHARRLELPSPMRDVRTLRTLVLLDLESHPPTAGIDRVSIIIDPTPGRVWQHTLFTRAHPTPEQLSTLIARLEALIGQNRIGRPARVDSYRPGAFGMQPFDHVPALLGPSASSVDSRLPPSSPGSNLQPLASALRRCRRPVPARVSVGADSRPVRVTTDRSGFAGGAVMSATGPWRSSGNWWAGKAEGTCKEWHRDEWDVVLNDGAVYRIFRDRDADAWFIDAFVD